MKRCIVLILMLSSFSFQSWSQLDSELEILSTIKYDNSPEETVKIRDQYEHIHVNTNEVQFVFSGLFLFINHLFLLRMVNLVLLRLLVQFMP